MRFTNILFVFSVWSICFFSCASTAKDNRLFTNITDSSKFFLLHTENIEQDMDMAQYITAEFRGQTYFIISWVKADKDSMEMNFFNEMGASIGELSYRDGKIHFSSNVIPKAALRRFRPEYIVADFQLCFYDPIALEKSLEESSPKNGGLVLEVQGDMRNGTRRILNGDEIIIEITKTDKMVRLDNKLRKYAFTFEGDFL